MSYCRWGPDSNVYVYDSSDPNGPAWTCHDCGLLDMGRSFVAATRAQMIAHLHEHELKGDKVPQEALERLLSEIVFPPCAHWIDVARIAAGIALTGQRTLGPLPARCEKCSLCQRYGGPNG